LTPAVYAAATAARVGPLPYLFICAVHRQCRELCAAHFQSGEPGHLWLPPLAQWLYKFTLPSIVSILITYPLLRFTQRAGMDQRISMNFQTKPLSVGGKCVAFGIILTALALLGAS
jgi:arsenical pump membrane protein